jgi:hypothetical protein
MNSPYQEENGARVLVSFAKIEFHEAFILDKDDVQLDEKMIIPSEDDS